ncbi:hypothetical protein C8F04DRAFT_1282792 [Mycena alexandri]|uniref:Uncharacterized protein n=1 Tax=Mycena alexandri TaxID=1745969 RepID=A0AAD6RW73_9AGAR|nr:hypothetical protein C8F04DRAFT_1282792 [Mycena alexandri]
MDNYDTKEAGILIGKWVEEMKTKLIDNYTVAAANAAADSVTVSEAGIPKAHKVLLRGKDRRREAVFTVIGAIINKAFPPVNSASVLRHSAHLAAQEITVGGLGDATFRQSIKNLDDVCYKLSVQFPEGSVDNWAATTGDHGETLKATCCYFTMGNNTPAEVKVLFASNVDPQKVLEKLTSESISHCKDNDVDYLEWKDEKLIRKNPVRFRVGDIVQVGILVCAFRASKTGNTPRYMCKLVLRSVTLLDVSMTRRAQASRLEAEKKNPNPAFNARAFKRTRAQIESDSEDDELPTARQKMSNLTIEDVIMNERKQDQ